MSISLIKIELNEFITDYVFTKLEGHMGPSQVITIIFQYLKYVSFKITDLEELCRGS